MPLTVLNIIIRVGENNGFVSLMSPMDGRKGRIIRGIVLYFYTFSLFSGRRTSSGGEYVYLHLAYDIAAANFDGDLADARFRGYLFVKNNSRHRPGRITFLRI